MNKQIRIALVVYLRALKDSGEFKSIHMSHVIPMHTSRSAAERRAAGEEYWTQFPEMPELEGIEGIKYDQSSGMVYFDLCLYARAQATK